MEWLQGILEEGNNASEVMTKIKQELPKHFIPKDKYNELAESKRVTEEQAAADGAAALKGFAVDFAVRSLSGASSPRDFKIVKELIDSDGIEIGEDYSVSGVFEQIEALRKDKPFLFGGNAVAGRSPIAAADSLSVSREQFGAMSYREKMDIYAKSPELYKQLI